MEARTWWKRCRTAQTVDALDRGASTKLLFNGVRRSFGDVAPAICGKLEARRTTTRDLSAT